MKKLLVFPIAVLIIISIGTSSVKVAHAGVLSDYIAQQIANALKDLKIQKNLPLLITNVQSVNTASDSTTISWKTNKVADSEVTYWKIPLKKKDVTQNEYVATSTKQHAVALKNLTPETAYVYTVTSVDSYGKKQTSLKQTFTTLPAPIPLEILNVQATSTTESSTVITWETNRETSGSLTYWKVATSGSSTSPVTVLATTSPNSMLHSIILGNLGASTQYKYFVTSEDSLGNTASSTEESFTTLDLPPPSPASTIYDSNDPTKSFWDLELSDGDYIVTEKNTTNSNERLLRISPSGNVSVIATYPGQLWGLTLDGSDFIVTGSNSGTANLLRISATGTISVIAPSVPVGGALTDVVVFDSAYIVADAPHNQLLKITPDGDISVFATSIGNHLRGLRVINNNIIAPSSFGNCQGRLYRISPEAVVSVIASEPDLFVCSVYEAVTLNNQGFFLVSTWDNKIKRIGADESIETLTNYGNIHGHSTIGLLTDENSVITTSGFPSKILRITP